MTQMIDNQALEDAMRAVANGDTPENRRILYEAMAHTSFLVPLEAAGALPAEELPRTRLGRPIAGPESPELTIVVCENGDQHVAVAFTHEDALKSWDENVPWIVLKGAEMFKAVLETGADEIVVNPFEPEKNIGLVRPGGRVTHWEIEYLAEGKSPQDEMEDKAAGMAAEPTQPVLLSMPAQMPPPALFDALTAGAKTVPVVRAMYFCQMSQGAETRKVIAVEFASGAATEAKNAAIDVFREALEPMLGEEEVVDFFGTSNDTGAAIAATGKRFYSA